MRIRELNTGYWDIAGHADAEYVDLWPAILETTLTKAMATVVDEEEIKQWGRRIASV
ncbi:hypothetical protein ACFZBU_46445 [Embleya sp. NPDC008237]|uniref:hypothetical protein n=1 Tax=Embleya sp. NPDC008237 TaxID=3363978 RepID=UPI0036EBE76B